MTAPAAPREPWITEPGVYDITAAEYHADPVVGGSLSSTGVKKLLPPSCPALYRYEADHGQPPRDVFAFGRAAHARVLGVGDPVTVMELPDGRTKAGKAAAAKKADIEKAGGTVITPEQDELTETMAAALREHPVASLLLHPDSGTPEQALVWQDADTGVWRRALLDWLPHPPAPGRRLIVPDYKTAADVDPESIGKAIATFGYARQARYYLDGVQALGLDGGQIDPAFVLIFQSKNPPHLVVCTEITLGDLAQAAIEIRGALDIYAWCTRHNTWPGYADDTVLDVPAPAWHRYQHEAAYARGDYHAPEHQPTLTEAHR